MELKEAILRHVSLNERGEDLVGDLCACFKQGHFTTSYDRVASLLENVLDEPRSRPRLSRALLKDCFLVDHQSKIDESLLSLVEY